MPRAPKLRVESDACFLNIPYDSKFENLYLAYIVGLTAHGLVPRATLGVPEINDGFSAFSISSGAIDTLSMTFPEFS